MASQVLPQVTVTAVTVGQSHAPIENFLQSMVDVARPNRFDAKIILPGLILDKLTSEIGNYGIKRILQLRCESTELPGRMFGTVEQKFGSNPTTKFPMHSAYNDLIMTFIVSDTMIERTLFDVWMEYINPTTTFDFDYKSNFVSDITVTQYDMQDKAVYTVNFYNAYPILVNQMDLDWSNDGYHKVTVVFAYDYWQNQGLNTLGNPLATNSVYDPFKLKGTSSTTS
jgi:hypothetical protein